jgi:hypothetical protein
MTTAISVSFMASRGPASAAPPDGSGAWVRTRVAGDTRALVFQNSREAMRTLGHRGHCLTSGSTAACPTHVPKPQSLPAITFSRPTRFA